MENELCNLWLHNRSLKSIRQTSFSFIFQEIILYWILVSSAILLWLYLEINFLPVIILNQNEFIFLSTRLIFL